MGEVVQFVPRNAVDGKPMLEQIAVEAVESITAPCCHDDIQGEGGSVLKQMYESSLGYVEDEGC